MKNDNAQTPARQRPRRRKGAALLLILLVSTVLYAPAVFAERTVDPPEASQVWVSWALLIAFAGLCCGIAFKNPKRSHQA